MFSLLSLRHACTFARGEIDDSDDYDDNDDDNDNDNNKIPTFHKINYYLQRPKV
jgi:hypothetical protein